VALQILAEIPKQYIREVKPSFHDHNALEGIWVFRKSLVDDLFTLYAEVRKEFFMFDRSDDILIAAMNLVS
jgi:hypothetical protein